VVNGDVGVAMLLLYGPLYYSVVELELVLLPLKKFHLDEASATT
jgi:hypothetical protein